MSTAEAKQIEGVVKFKILSLYIYRTTRSKSKKLKRRT